MAISQKDNEFMQEVTEYFKSTITESNPNGSIRETALKFKITRTKARKILVTKGLLDTPLVQRISELRKLDMSINEIASELGIAASSVSTYLPYEVKVDHSLDPSHHASKVREYRSYEKQQLQRQEKYKKQQSQERNLIKAEWENDVKMSFNETFHRPHRETWMDAEELRKRLEAQASDEERELYRQLAVDLVEIRKQEAEEFVPLQSLPPDTSGIEERKKEHGLYPGALCDRNRVELEQLYGGQLPFEPMDILRLHIELCNPYRVYSVVPVNQSTSDILHRYGGVSHGRTVSCDIVIPSDLPLYALHYVLQKTFGWHNEKRHHFFIPWERIKLLCHDNLSMWSCLVGILFRSPMMSYKNELWLDDYTGGSIKNWLRKKYTGPYLSLNGSENLIPCQEQMMQLDMNKEFLVCYEKDEAGKEHPVAIYYKESNQIPNMPDGTPYCQVKSAKLEQLNVEEMTQFFKHDPFALVERLPLDSVIVSGKDKLSDCLSPEEKEKTGICETGQEMYNAIGEYVWDIVRANEDLPEKQVYTMPFTDMLYYVYGKWAVKITASNNCPDLMNLISQNDLDQANLKCRDTYRPVLISRDGMPPLDQPEGLKGYCQFLNEINPDLKSLPKNQQNKAKRLRREKLEWAKSQGWQRDKSSNINFL